MKRRFVVIYSLRLDETAEKNLGFISARTWDSRAKVIRRLINLAVEDWAHVSIRYFPIVSSDDSDSLSRNEVKS